MKKDAKRPGMEIIMKKHRLLCTALSCTLLLTSWGISPHSAVSAAARVTDNQPLTEEELKADDPGYSRLSDNSIKEQSDDTGEQSPFIIFNPQMSSKKTGSTSISPYTGATYTHADSFDGMNIYHGVDVSYYQKTIDWEKVKADGIDYVFVRMGYRGYSSGTLVTDTMFKANMEGAIAAGLKVGVYFFTEAVNTDEAVAEAQYVAEAIKPYNITMPVALDWEFNTSGGQKVGRKYTAGLTKAQYTTICTAFCDVIKTYGYTPMIYANKSDFSTYLDGAALGEKYEIWLARYNTIADYSNKYSFWQYSAGSAANPGTVDGINGYVDLNFWYTSGDINNPTFTHSPSSSAVTASPTPTALPDNVSAVTNLSAESGAKKITLSWKTVKNATGYQIYRKDTYNGSYKKVKTITNAATTSWKNTGLSKKHEYYYRVRSYIKADDGNILSDFVNITAATKSYSQVALTKSSIKLLKKPSASAKKLTSVPKGTSIVYDGCTHLKNGKTFHHVRYVTTAKTYDGYLPSKTSLKYYKQGITTAKLNLRKKPGITGTLIAKIPKNTAIALQGQKKVKGTIWYQTTYSGKKGKIFNGYVSSEYIR